MYLQQLVIILSSFIYCVHSTTRCNAPEALQSQQSTMHKSRNISAKNREDIIVAILIERKLGEDLIFLEHYYNRYTARFKVNGSKLFCIGL